MTAVAVLARGCPRRVASSEIHLQTCLQHARANDGGLRKYRAAPHRVCGLVCGIGPRQPRVTEEALIITDFWFLLRHNTPTPIPKSRTLGLWTAPCVRAIHSGGTIYFERRLRRLPPLPLDRTVRLELPRYNVEVNRALDAGDLPVCWWCIGLDIEVAGPPRLPALPPLPRLLLPAPSTGLVTNCTMVSSSSASSSSSAMISLRHVAPVP